MKHVTLLTLLMFAPLSWGEEVWYCVEEQSMKIEESEETGTYITKKYQPEKFTLKYEAESNRLAVKGRSWAGSELFYLACDTCYPDAVLLKAKSLTVKFQLMGDRFFVSSITVDKAGVSTGTCAKF